MKTYQPRPREMAQEQICAYILEHKLKPYDLLPTEREMCEMWGFNRCTLRSAIKRLVAEGQLSTKQGSGIWISPRFSRFVQGLQGFSEHADKHGYKIETQLLSFSEVECDASLAKRFERVLGEKIYRISRLRLLDDTPMMIEHSFIPCAFAPNLEEHDLIHNSLFSILREVYNLELDHGHENASITSATEDEAAILNIQEGDPVFWLVSNTENQNNQLVEYCRAIGRSDMLELISTIHWTGGKE